MMQGRGTQGSSINDVTTLSEWGGSRIFCNSWKAFILKIDNRVKVDEKFRKLRDVIHGRPRKENLSIINCFHLPMFYQILPKFV